MKFRPPTLLLLALIVAAGWYCYAPVLHGGWLWDDDVYITGNAALRAPGGPGALWVSPTGPNYFPVTSTVQWVQWRLWRDDPFGYHVTNVVLHVLSGLLLWRLLAKLRGGPASPWLGLGALLWVVHPLTVESVAWISELKNTLSLPLLLGAMLAYLAYDERWSALPPTRLSPGGVEPARWGQRAPPYILTLYILALLLFTLAMLSKSLVVAFPLVILLHAWWRRGRVAGADLRASAPFFLVSVALGLVTMAYERRDMGVGIVPVESPLFRVVGAGRALVFYAQKSVLPFGLLPVYPRWHLHPLSPGELWAWPALFGVLAWLWTRRATWGRPALLGLGFFLLNLAPVLGFLPLSYQAHAWVADHFAYYALIGPIGLAAGGCALAVKRLPPFAEGLAVAGAIALCAALATQSRGYARNFASQESLWTYTLQQNPDAWVAHVNLGNLLDRDGHSTQAIAEYRAAVQLVPANVTVHENLGLALMHADQQAAAKEEFEEAVRLNPAYPDAQANLGVALANLGRYREGIAAAAEAVRLAPDYATVHDNLGNILVRADRRAEGLEQFRRALQLSPGDADAHRDLGLALLGGGQMAEAIAQFEEALRLGPGSAEARRNLGDARFNQANALAQDGQFEAAVAEYRQVLGLRPDFPQAEVNLGNVLFSLHRFPEAVGHYRTALRLKPDYADAHYDLGLALRALGENAGSATEIEAARRLGAGH